MSLSKQVFLAKYGHDGHVKAALKSDDKVVRMSAASNQTISKENIETALADGRPSVRHCALKNPTCPQKHLTSAMKNGNGDMDDMRKVMENPNATTKHIDSAIKSDSYHVISTAASHKNTTPTHIDKMLHHSSYIRSDVIEHNPNISKEQLLRIRDSYPKYDKELAQSRLDKSDHK